MPISFGRRRLIVMVSLLLMGIVVSLAGLGLPPGVARAVTIACAAPLASPATPADATPQSASAGVIPFPDGGGELTVFAAASLTDSFTAIGKELEASNPGLSITFNFAGSAALVTQIREGAPADVVALAGKKPNDVAIEEGLIAGESTIFARNRLALVVPSDNPANIASAADLGADGVKLVVAAGEVPAGQYARESLCKMSADPASYGEGFSERVAANIVSEEDNVKSVLTKVRLGEADAGIVYTTDVTNEVAGEVQLIEIPAAVNVTASYPISAVAGGNCALPAAFISYVLGPDGQAVLASFGFEAGA